ncbi:hypothetical protein [Rubripirellula reticaptiva]|nr:hypothetical protein [Rubripirellula reticaptiva]
MLPLMLPLMFAGRDSRSMHRSLRIEGDSLSDSKPIESPIVTAEV